MAPLGLRRFAPAAAYTVLALAVIAPWLRPGYIFALDMVFTPRLRVPDTVTSSYAFHAFLHILNSVLPSHIIQKIILFAVFFLAGLGAHRLARLAGAGQSGAYFAGILYAVNPFVYDRLMTGQYSVLLGYALLPFFVRSLLIFLRRPTFRQSLLATLWATVIGIISIHTLGPAAVIALAASIVWLVKNRYIRPWVRAFWQESGAAVGLFVLLNSYWLLPLALGKGATAAQIASFAAGDSAAFATTGTSLAGKLLHVISLRGFWAENHGIYLQPAQQVGAWWLLAGLLWLLVAMGGVLLWRDGRRAMTVLFGAATIVGALLAAGFGFMQHVPILAGFREPHKFAGLVAIGFAVFGAIGVTHLVRSVRHEFDSKVSAAVAAVLALAVPLVVTSTIFWGARGQLAARTYPPEWHTINARLNADPGRFNTLFLPWHHYMRFEFAGRVVTHPAPDFFDKPVIVSDQSELGDVAPVRPTAATRKLGEILPDASKNFEHFARQLAALRIQYVILDREEDYREYDYLRRAPGLQRITRTGTLELYRNELYGENHAQ